MTSVQSIQEAIASEVPDTPDVVTIPLNGYVHLLNTDAHSNQSDVGYYVAELSPDTPYSFERWIRIKFTGSYTVSKFRFWASLTVPNGWEVKWGSATDFTDPVNVASSIATDDVPTSEPGTENCGGASSVTDGANYSDWIVIQAHVPDFSAIGPGPMLGSTGGEVINPVLIAYHFTWLEGGIGMASGTVYLYDGFYGLNPYNDFGSIYVALVTSDYTFDKTHATYSSDISPYEASGDGYSEVNIVFELDGNPTEESDMRGDVTFGACTIDDFQYVVYYVNYDVPVLIIDLGSPQSVVDQGVAVAGTLWTYTPAP